ncbi:MAG: GTPase [Liquorilactobacillus hordei]|uniref:YcjF family protein n=1 Tax=Liquorilactobacillus hordei TaxID=468911 RepID=UPI0039E880E1
MTEYIRNEAKIVIHTASVAAATGASPIPFSDAAILIPVQTTMIAGIYHAYGKSLSSGAIKGALTATAVAGLGKSAVGNLLKFIPGVGTVTGAIINGGVASTFTEAMGVAVASALSEDGIENTSDLIEILKTFTANFKK